MRSKRYFGAVVFFIVAVCSAGVRAQAPDTYWPAPGEWERRRPSEVGMNDAAISHAVEWARQQETDWPRDFSTQSEIFGRALGPVAKERAGTNGVIVRRGYIIAEFGDVNAVDPSYSIAKSYLSTILGVTIDKGLIKSVDDPVQKSVRDGGYESEHNAKVTWRHHVTQTSEWEGEMFGKPHTFVGKEEFGRDARSAREVEEPGTRYEYNDVRINRFALSLLRVWKRPLPDVMKSEIMDPIGASGSWKYIAYDNAVVDVEGTPMASVSGGTRWGGGLWMSTLDHARFGLLMLRKGQWGDKRVVSEAWVREATHPQGVKEDYGLLWWLNTREAWPGAPKESFSAQGAGTNSIWVDPEHDLVIVWRWHRGGNVQADLYRRVLGAIRDP